MTKSAVGEAEWLPRWRVWLAQFAAYEDAFFSDPGDTRDHRLARLEREMADLRSQVSDLQIAAASRIGSGPAQG